MSAVGAARGSRRESPPRTFNHWPSSISRPAPASMSGSRPICRKLVCRGMASARLWLRQQCLGNDGDVAGHHRPASSVHISKARTSRRFSAEAKMSTAPNGGVSTGSRHLHGDNCLIKSRCQHARAGTHASGWQLDTTDRQSFTWPATRSPSAASGARRSAAAGRGTS